MCQHHYLFKWCAENYFFLKRLAKVYIQQRLFLLDKKKKCCLLFNILDYIIETVTIVY